MRAFAEANRPVLPGILGMRLAQHRPICSASFVDAVWRSPRANHESEPTGRSSAGGDFAAVSPSRASRRCSHAMECRGEMELERLSHCGHPHLVAQHVTVDSDVALDVDDLFRCRGAGHRHRA